ncbi:hypothetical protein ZEAMMB73_Zm00001d045008 [Zea mays]|uniref:Uncharacterized protein n=1 Tax=Zea mays TaxID=4577 RepID=K7VQZ1_MAIZE|nr:hypothetical protein ZEAMMB73_Zm00001d045008 [Zea mays]
MVDVFTAFGFVNLCLAFTFLQISTFPDPQLAADSTMASAEAPLPSAAVLFLAAVPVAGAGNGRRRSISGLLIFVLCVSAGTLELIVFGKAAVGGTAEARALGLPDLPALPAAATATFFSGMTLVIVAAHRRAGGEDEGGGGGAVAGDGRPTQGLLRLTAGAAAAALVGLMAMPLIVILYGAK